LELGDLDLFSVDDYAHYVTKATPGLPPPRHIQIERSIYVGIYIGGMLGGSSCVRLWCCSCRVFVWVTCFSFYKAD